MPQVSKNKLSKRAEEELVKNLNLVLAKIEKTDDMGIFLQVFMTDTERIMFGKRLALVILLEEKLPDAEIASILNITRMTVAKMRYFYEARGGGFKIALRKLEEQKKLDSFKKFLISLTNYSVRAASGHVKL